MPLLVELYAEGVDFILTSGIFNLNNLLDLALALLFLFDYHLLSIYNVSQTLCFLIQLLLFDFQKVQSLHERFDTRLS